MADVATRRALTRLPEALRPRRAAQEITWAPLAIERRLLFNGTSYLAVRDALVTVFGEFPIKLQFSDEFGVHAEILKAMAAAAGEGSTPYDDLLEALTRHHGLVLSDFAG